MAKKYHVKNITTTPARPIILMCCACGGSLGGKNSKLVNTDAEGVILCESDYKHCKEALDRYEAADMVVVKEIEGELTEDEKAEFEKREKANAKAKADSELIGLREEGKALKIPAYHKMGIEKLKSAIAKATDEE